MKRFLCMIIVAAMLLPTVALAEPEIIVIDVLPTPTPTAPPTIEPACREYEWDSGTIDALASVYWAECNTDAEKLAVTKLIVNRAAAGAPFASTIEGAAMQGKEFNRGHISDRNRALARVNLNRVQTQADGEYAGVTVPRSAVYMGRDSGVLVMYDAAWTEVWRAGKVGV